MKLLLDTPILLWGLLEPERLALGVSVALADPSNELWLSPVSTWELLLLVERGRVRLEGDPVRWLRRVHRRLRLHEAALTHEVALQSLRVDLPYQDLADRVIAATARVYGLTLVTGEERLAQAGGFPVLANA